LPIHSQFEDTLSGMSLLTYEILMRRKTGSHTALSFGRYTSSTEGNSPSLPREILQHTRTSVTHQKI